MKFPIFITLATLATAVPFGSSSPAPSSSPTPTPTPTAKSPATSTNNDNEILESMIAADVKKTSDLSTCPSGHEFKACCKTINNLTEQLLKPVTQLLPVLDGASISSTASFQCQAIGDEESNDQCTHDVMCCGKDPNKNKGPNSCLPFDVAIKKKKKALDNNKKFGLNRDGPLVVGTKEGTPSLSSWKLISTPTPR
ncbi:hypothetical protein FE257_010295 [Aspergillus nanangensis]|uniref:Hydrophobin n=1 Tax=Aspergillus nanangensis TaxID=2582783 RepID=A0AAD4CIU5_ASPNN|nr:hypothetical protein FE257_010295 [Aspergillus nanangensis]